MTKEDVSHITEMTLTFEHKESVAKFRITGPAKNASEMHKMLAVEFAHYNTSAWNWTYLNSLPLSPARKILKEILFAHCNAWGNLDKVRKMAGIADPYFFCAYIDDITYLVLHILPEGMVEEIINKMPFPFVKSYNKDEDFLQAFYSQGIYNIRKSDYWIEEVLAPVKRKVGNGIVSLVTGYGISFRKR